MQVKTAVLGLAFIVLVPGTASAMHNCGTEPNMSSEKVKVVASGDYITVWRGQNWKGRVFVKIVAKDGSAGTGKFWTNLFGGERQTAQSFSDFHVFKIDAPANGEELKFKADAPGILAACSLQEFHEDDQEIANMFADLATCGADPQCFGDKWEQKTLPHSSEIFP
jgi:hypothetical protein